MSKLETLTRKVLRRKAEIKVVYCQRSGKTTQRLTCKPTAEKNRYKIMLNPYHWIEVEVKL